MANYSHSKLGTFEQCRYKYKLHYIDKIKMEAGADSVEAFLGKRIHETLQKLYVDLKFQKANTLKDLLAYFNKIWDKEWTDDIIINKKEYTAENYRKMSEKYITDYYNRYKPFDQMTVLGIETDDSLHLPDGSHYAVRIDRLCCKSDTYYVCDYKASNRMKDQEEANQDRQLAMYSIWVKNQFHDAKKVVLLWHMLAFDKEVISERNDKQLSKLQAEILDLIKKIEKCKDFPTNVTALCDYCEYQTICPAFKHKIELEEKTVKEFKKDDGVKLIDEFSTLQLQKREIEARMEQIKNDLIEFAKQKGLTIVYGSNKKASIKEYWDIIYPEDKEAFVQLMKKKGLYAEFSILCHHKLNAAILRGDITDKDIMKQVKKEKDYRVSLSKRKEEEE